MAAATASTSAIDAATATDTMGEVDSVYTELISFLSSPRADLRKAAAEATLAALTDQSNNESARRLASLNAVRPLCRIASAASSDEGSADALAALSVLCSHDLVGNQCVLDFVEEAGGVGRMIEIALSSPPTPPSTAASIAALAENDDEENKDGSQNNELASQWNEWRKQVNYACALLANATRTEQGAAEFIGLSLPKEAVKAEDAGGEKRDTAKPTATLLLSRFLNPSFIDASSPACKAAEKAFSVPKHRISSFNNLDEYDSDLDDEELEQEEEPMTTSEAPQSAEPTMKDREYYDPYQHVAAVIMNIAQLDTGRDFLMRLIHSSASKKSNNSNNNNTLDSIQENETSETKEETATTTSSSHLQSLLPQLASPNVHRRRGVSGTLKNCCFSRDTSWWLLHVVRIDKSLLAPLCGPEELTLEERVGLDPDLWLAGPNKLREPDPLVRKYVAEALLLLLASGRAARETLRERRTYVIVKLADMVEEDEGVGERLLEIVQYLRRDEDGEEEGSSDRRAYERYARGMREEDGARNEGRRRALPPPSTSVGDDGSGADSKAGGAEGEDYDNID